MWTITTITKKIKILHLRSGDEILGAERVILELCNFLPKYGFSSMIGIPDELHDPRPAFAEAAQAEDITVIKFPISGPFDPRALTKIRRFVAGNEIDIVHSHGYREDLYALGCSKYATLVATNHLWKRTTNRLRIYAKLDALLLRKFPKVIAVSAAIAEDMRLSGLRQEQIEVISNGIDTDLFSGLSCDHLREEFGLGRSNVVLGTVSSLTSEKGLHHAIQAFAICRPKCPELRMLIVGAGPEEPVLRQLVVEMGLADFIIFAGRRADVDRAYRTFDIFLLPSLTEGLPMALLEAMAAGLPAIASAVGDVPKLVDRDVGALVPPGDYSQLADAISQLATDSVARKQLGLNGRERVIRDYSSRTMASRYADIYNHLVANAQL